MRSWRTTTVGGVLIIGAISSLAISAKVNKRFPSNEELTLAGGTIATGVGLISARDNNKSSKNVEVR